MESPRRLHLKTFILILIMVLAGPLGNVLLGKAMKQVGPVHPWPPAELLHVFIRVFTSGTIWLGVGSLLVFFAAYMIVLSWADYSYVQPASSISYAVVALLASTWLGEFVLLMFFVVVFGTVGEIFVSRAMKEHGEVKDFRPGALIAVILRALRSRWMWLGVA